ncbi:MAG: alpha/beta fold hydrolase [Roseovarius sp.]
MSIFAKKNGWTDHVETFDGIQIAWSMAGAGPPLLLLHGFPQTRALWAQVAPKLAKTHTVICPDLRGYGGSGKPDGVEHYSFRAMAQDQLALMHHLGFDRFDLAGHDRGGRVGHRLALDAPQAINRLCVMDIVPTHTVLDDLRVDVATAYYHWFFLAQPWPFPETLIRRDADFYYEACLLGWGGASLDDLNPEQLNAYRTAWRDPDTIRAMCDDYRAALTHDIHHDTADLGSSVSCPTMVLYGADGAMARTYDVPAQWAQKCTDLRAEAMPGGHFFIDTHPDATSAALTAFFAGTPQSL